MERLRNFLFPVIFLFSFFAFAEFHRVRISSNNLNFITGVVGSNAVYLSYDINGDRIIDKLLYGDSEKVIEASFNGGHLAKLELRKVTKTHSILQIFVADGKVLRFKTQIVLPLRRHGNSELDSKACSIKSLFHNLEVWNQSVEKVLNKAFIQDSVKGIDSCSVLSGQNKSVLDVGIKSIYGIDFAGNVDQMPLLKCMFDNPALKKDVLPSVYLNLASLRAKPSKNCIKCAWDDKVCGPSSYSDGCISVSYNAGCVFEKNDLSQKLFHEMLHQVDNPLIEEERIKNITDICFKRELGASQANAIEYTSKVPGFAEVEAVGGQVVAEAGSANLKPAAIDEVIGSPPIGPSHALNRSFGDTRADAQTRSFEGVEYRVLEKVMAPAVRFANVALASVPSFAGNLAAFWEGDSAGKVYKMPPGWMSGSINFDTNRKARSVVGGSEDSTSVVDSEIRSSVIGSSAQKGASVDKFKRSPASPTGAGGVEGVASSSINIPESTNSERKIASVNYADNLVIQSIDGYSGKQKKEVQEIFDGFRKAKNRRELINLIVQSENRLKKLNVTIFNPQAYRLADIESGKSEKKTYGFGAPDEAKFKAFINNEGQLEIRP